MRNFVSMIGLKGSYTIFLVKYYSRCVLLKPIEINSTLLLVDRKNQACPIKSIDYGTTYTYQHFHQIILQFSNLYK